ncbi:5731_t:CDS:2 [Funneliformis caledonium]|uniref:5731_t:CDS:1 n=1 Tax=Funneliformis caledonium TaxID=1117310 RepID=A0A9N9C9N9_9GLOM|nr:5731_t:CDS:2 [Funneliformis caledonium]
MQTERASLQAGLAWLGLSIDLHDPSRVEPKKSGSTRAVER